MIPSKDTNWVVVTGASRGIGRAISETLIRDGYGVIGVARATPTLEATKKELTELGNFVSAPLDLRDHDGVNNFWSKIKEEYRIVGLVNNAGIEISGPAENVTSEDLRNLFDLNVGSLYLSCVGAFHAFRLSGKGAIVNIASVDAHRGLATMAAYCSSKAAVLGLTKALAVEWARYGIRVNSVSPGAVSTDMTAALHEDSKGYSFLMARTPQRRFASPPEIAGAVRYLLSAEASFVTGIDIAVDGGFLA